MQHYDNWLQLKQQHPKKYARDIARLMNISEAELTYSRTGHDARRLNGEIRTILAALEAVGEIKAICRNEYAVHEHLGCFTHQHLGEHAGVILNPRDLDLRVFVNHWASVFHLRETTPHAERQSIQFFDHQGDALLKVYATDNTDIAAWGQLVAKFTAASNPPLELQPVPNTPQAPLPDAHMIETQWRAMKDVHQFFELLKKHQITRQQAFRLVSDSLAMQVNNNALEHVLSQAQQDGNEIMIFVGNRGCVQIFTGVVEKLAPIDNWLNIFNPRFTLHLLKDTIAESWITRKPCDSGHVTSLELFAADGTQIAQLYGQRTEGDSEQLQWREQMGALNAGELTP